MGLCSEERLGGGQRSSREHVCEHGFPRPPPGNHSWPRPRNKHSVAGQADALAPVSRSCPAGVPYMWQAPEGVLPIWPWVIRQPLSSCQTGLTSSLHNLCVLSQGLLWRGHS